MGSGGSPAAHFCENGGVPVAGKKTEYRRIRMDSGHHRRIRLTAAVLGLLAFVPALSSNFKSAIMLIRRLLLKKLMPQHRMTLLL